MTEAQGCQHFAYSCCAEGSEPESNPQPPDRWSNTLPVVPLCHPANTNTDDNCF